MYLENLILLHRHFQLASENEGNNYFNSSLTMCSQFDPQVKLLPTCSESAAVSAGTKILRRSVWELMYLECLSSYIVTSN